MLHALAALAIAAQGGEHVKVELATSLTTALPGKSFLAAVIIRTDPGWHVYWTNPGDAGTPTKIEWHLPEGWTAGELMWPVPSRFAEKSLVTYGYEGSTMVLARITTPEATRVGPVTFTATASWEAVGPAGRVPGTKLLKRQQTLGLAEMPSNMWGDRLVAAEASMPRGLEGWKSEAQTVDGGFILKCTPPQKLPEFTFLPSFFILDPGVLDHSWPQTLRVREDGSIWIALKKAAKLENPPATINGLLVAPKDMLWQDGVGAITIHAPVK